MKIRNLLLIAVVALLFVSCKEPQQVPYMTNIDQIPPAALATATTQAGDFTIKPGDMLLSSLDGIFIINLHAVSNLYMIPFEVV